MTLFKILITLETFARMSHFVHKQNYKTLYSHVLPSDSLLPFCLYIIIIITLWNIFFLDEEKLFQRISYYTRNLI